MQAAYSQLDSLKTIRAFQMVNGQLSSSGFVKDYEFSFIKQSGYQHVISLLPGDQDGEKSIVESLDMSFTSIAVDWNKPTLKNLDSYFKDMERNSGKKVHTHCEASMRASAFLFLYRVISQGTDIKLARAAMDSIWYPTGTWHSFIGEALKANGLDPEYRFETDFVKLLREEGVVAAEQSLYRILESGGEIPFTETDLSRVADEYAAAKRTDDAILIYTLNTIAFPESWNTHSQLGNFLLNSGDNEAAMSSYERVVELDPDNLWAKRMLGKLGSPAHEIFWSGIEISPEIILPLAGTYDLGNATLEFIASARSFLMKPSWSKKKFELYSDSPDTYFVRENNWMFEFPVRKEGQARKVLFIRPGITLSGEHK